MYAFRLLALFVVVLSVTPARALGQTPDPAPPAGGARVSFGGEISATASPSDGTAFFDYTDYEHNGLRTAQVRLFGEWHVNGRLSVLSEFQAINTDQASLAALYGRWTPSAAHHFDIQFGRIPPVVGAYARRAYGRDNLVIGVPLAYQYLTALRPDALPATIDDLLRMKARGWEPSYPIGSQTVSTGLSLVSSNRWDTGVEVHGHLAAFDLAGAWTRGAPAAPSVTTTNRGGEWSGRAAFESASGVTLGASIARGSWINDTLADHLSTPGRPSIAQTLAATDLDIARGHTIVRAELLHAHFDLPLAATETPISGLGAWSGFIEARYRFRPRLQAAIHGDFLNFSDVRGTLFGGAPTPWDAPVRRVETTLGFRVQRRVEVDVGWQENWRDGGRVTVLGVPMLHVLAWF